MRQKYGFASESDVYVLPGEDSADRPVSKASAAAAPLRNERKACRQKLPPQRRRCQLKLGANVLPALILDISERGFGLLINGQHDLAVGQKVHLHTERGWFMIRLVHVAEVVPPKGAATDPSDCSQWFRLGCFRVGRGPLPNEPSASPSLESVWVRLARKLFSSADA
jgi:hypothetical protein